FVTLVCGDARDCVEQLFVQLGVDCSVCAAKVGKVSVELRTLIGYESVRLERRMWRYQDQGFRATRDDALGHLRHSIDRSAHFRDSFAPHFGHHYRRMWSNPRKHNRAFITHETNAPRIGKLAQ